MMRRVVTAPGNKAHLALLFAFLLLPFYASVAQEGSTSPPSEVNSATSEHRPSNAAKMSRESREAAGEGENAEFKHSATVRKIAEKTGLSVNQVYWLSVLVNFGVIFIVILWAAKKNLPAAFRNRTAQIQKAMEEARKASEDANRRLAEIESRLSQLDSEIGQMRSAAEQDAAAEETRVRAAAEEDTRKIVQSAEQEIAAAAKSARRELASHAASLAVSLAAKQIHVDQATDESLLRDFMRGLSSSEKDGR
jgi:F-type H+-transporting ATPase subunit b